MSYSSGYLHNIVTIRNKVVATGFGETTSWQDAGCVHARKIWKSGNKVLRESALDAIDVVIFRMRWNNIIDRDCLLECEGVRYQIQSLHADRHEDTLQITATEILK